MTHLLREARLEANFEPASKSGVPALLIGARTQALIEGLFQRSDFFEGLPSIESRIVLWGHAREPVQLQHRAVVLPERELTRRLQAGLSQQRGKAPAEDWTVFTAAAPNVEHRFGQRMATVTTVDLADQAEPLACWIESVKGGWLFLLPGRERHKRSLAERLRAFGKKTGDGNDRLRVGSIGEMAADGGFTGPTAWMLTDYKGQPGFRGRAFYTPEQILANIDEGHKLGWQFGIHTIGNAAIEMTVDALHQVLQKNPRNDHRHYLCHFTMMPSDRTMDIMANDKIHIAQQPNFTYNLAGRYEETVEGRLLQTNNPLSTPIKHGIYMAIGSDNLPIGPVVGL